MSRDVAAFVKKCTQCQMNKSQIKHKEPMCITMTPQKAFDVVCVDTIGPFVKTNQGNVYAVTLQCELTKYIAIIPVSNKSAKTVATAIFNDFITIYGPMVEIRSDMGTEYKNQVIETLTSLLNINHKFSTAYHSQTIGGCERNHRVFNEFLRTYINDSHDDWDVWSKYYSFCYNTTPSTYHDYTPYELVFGKPSRLPLFLLESKVDPVYDVDSYYQEVKLRLQIAHSRAKQFLEKSKLQRKQTYDEKSTPRSLQIGDSVILTKDQRQKLDPWFVGPYKVIDINGVNSTIETKNGKKITVHSNRLKPFFV